jgi:hypothetical protein
VQRVGKWVKNGFNCSMGKGHMELQATSGSNVARAPLLQSAPRTGCAGHCGNPRLNGQKKYEKGGGERAGA